MALLPSILRLLRAVRPIARIGKTYIVTRADDVREVFAQDAVFAAPYRPKLDLIMDRHRFILGMPDGAEYRQDLSALQRVVRPGDLPMLSANVSRMAQDIVQRSNGWVDVVSDLTRPIAFDFLADYLGIPEPPDADLQQWGTRLFEYVFVASDPPLQAEAADIAPRLRRHVQAAIDARRARPTSDDDVLSRCLALQTAGEAGYSDPEIVVALTGLIVGGPPQPPMVLPQAMEQLLRRPAALSMAQGFARADDDAGLWNCIMEAMRFDPLAPWLARETTEPFVLAAGTSRARNIPAGARVLASIASAMQDKRRVPQPSRFDPARPADAYIHFGFGLHECFGRHINRATLPRILKPLLVRPNLRRAKGAAGKLRRRGFLASSLIVEFD